MCHPGFVENYCYLVARKSNQPFAELHVSACSTSWHRKRLRRYVWREHQRVFLRIYTPDTLTRSCTAVAVDSRSRSPADFFWGSHIIRPSRPRPPLDQNQAPTSFKTPPSPHRLLDLQDSLDKLMHFLPQLSYFVPLKNGISSFRAQID